MATNVTEKDKTLNEIIAWCDQLSMEIKCTEDASTDRTYGKLRGLYLVYEHCQNMLGNSGTMPSEVPKSKRGSEMSRAETTAMLSELVEKRLRNQTAFWASEVNFDRNTPEERRVDYVGFKPLNVNGEPVPASVEKGCFGFYEVKSCMADFTSGNGLTFYGDQNYLVCTKELCDEIVWQKMVPPRVNAILTPDSTGSKLILGHVQSNHDMSYRRRPASEIFWAMVKANGKRTN